MREWKWSTFFMRRHTRGKENNDKKLKQESLLKLVIINIPINNNMDIEIIYHMDPSGVVLRYPELAGKVLQAIIYCQTCKNWKNLSYENSKTLSHCNFNHKTQKYVGGYCLTDECKRERLERESMEQFWRKAEEMQKRCDEADLRCETFFRNAMKEQEKGNK